MVTFAPVIVKGLLIVISSSVYMSVVGSLMPQAPTTKNLSLNRFSREVSITIMQAGPVGVICGPQPWITDGTLATLGSFGVRRTNPIPSESANRRGDTPKASWQVPVETLYLYHHESPDRRKPFHRR